MAKTWKLTLQLIDNGTPHYTEEYLKKELVDFFMRHTVDCEWKVMSLENTNLREKKLNPKDKIKRPDDPDCT